MRNARLFAGSSCRELASSIADRLGTQLSPCKLAKFSNGETSVEIGCSVRNMDVFIVQSIDGRVNDSLVELLILASACKGGSATKITAVLPYFPYAKQSKIKRHRGAITARMVANLLTVAGVDHVITMDLHSSQMQGFFTRPIDNLFAEPLFVRWIKSNITSWRDCVVVSKNPGATKRATSLADALKIDFAISNTDKRRRGMTSHPATVPSSPPDEGTDGAGLDGTVGDGSVTVSRLVSGHVVDDDHPSVSSAEEDEPIMAQSWYSTGTQSTTVMAGESSHSWTGGGINQHNSDDEEEAQLGSGRERMITVVGDVRDKVAIIVDDMLDRPGQFVATAEHLIKRAGAKLVFVMATHAVFAPGCVEAMEACDCIHRVVVTNSIPIPHAMLAASSKLALIDVAPIVSEAIRRNKHGRRIIIPTNSQAKASLNCTITMNNHIPQPFPRTSDSRNASAQTILCA